MAGPGLASWSTFMTGEIRVYNKRMDVPTDTTTGRPTNKSKQKKANAMRYAGY